MKDYSNVICFSASTQVYDLIVRKCAGVGQSKDF